MNIRRMASHCAPSRQPSSPCQVLSEALWTSDDGNCWYVDCGMVRAHFHDRNGHTGSVGWEDEGGCKSSSNHPDVGYVRRPRLSTVPIYFVASHEKDVNGNATAATWLRESNYTPENLLPSFWYHTVASVPVRTAMLMSLANHRHGSESRLHVCSGSSGSNLPHCPASSPPSPSFTLVSSLCRTVYRSVRPRIMSLECLWEVLL